MKNLFSIFLVVLFVFAFTSCSNDEITGGVINASTYTNECVGIVFEKPADWKYLSAEEIAAIANSDQTAEDLNALQETLLEKSSLYEMAAQNPTTGESVMVIYENSMLTAFRKFTSNEYAKTLSQDLIKRNYTCSEPQPYILCGTEFSKVTSETQSNGSTVYQNYYIQTQGKFVYMVVLTSTTSAQALETLFQ